MSANNYLTYDEQYKKILNQEEISRIKDYQLREIRTKYWNLRHKAFLDEHGTPDTKIGAVFDELCAREQKELDEYRKSHQEDEQNG